MHKIWCEGNVAFFEKKRFYDNPYNPSTESEKFKAWSEGYKATFLAYTCWSTITDAEMDEMFS